MDQSRRFLSALEENQPKLAKALHLLPESDADDRLVVYEYLPQKSSKDIPGSTWVRDTLPPEQQGRTAVSSYILAVHKLGFLEGVIYNLSTQAASFSHARVAVLKFDPDSCHYEGKLFGFTQTEAGGGALRGGEEGGEWTYNQGSRYLPAGYTKMTDENILQEARRLAGSSGYDLQGHNCEDFCRKLSPIICRDWDKASRFRFFNALQSDQTNTILHAIDRCLRIVGQLADQHPGLGLGLTRDYEQLLWGLPFHIHKRWRRASHFRLFDTVRPRRIPAVLYAVEKIEGPDRFLASTTSQSSEASSYRRLSTFVLGQEEYYIPGAPVSDRDRMDARENRIAKFTKILKFQLGRFPFWDTRWFAILSDQHRDTIKFWWLFSTGGTRWVPYFSRNSSAVIYGAFFFLAASASGSLLTLWLRMVLFMSLCRLTWFLTTTIFDVATGFAWGQSQESGENGRRWSILADKSLFVCFVVFWFVFMLFGVRNVFNILIECFVMLKEVSHLEQTSTGWTLGPATHFGLFLFYFVMFLISFTLMSFHILFFLLATALRLIMISTLVFLCIWIVARSPLGGRVWLCSPVVFFFLLYFLFEDIVPFTMSKGPGGLVILYLDSSLILSPWRWAPFLCFVLWQTGRAFSSQHDDLDMIHLEAIDYLVDNEFEDKEEHVLS